MVKVGMGEKKIVNFFRIKWEGQLVYLVAILTLVHPTIYKYLKTIADNMKTRSCNRSCSS
jgi:hypothetical protein